MYSLGLKTRTAANCLLVWIFMLALNACSNDHSVTFRTDDFVLAIDESGKLQSMRDKFNNEYLFRDTSQAFISIRTNGKFEQPTAMSFSSQTQEMSFQFTENRQVNVKVEEKATHLTFEVLSATDIEDIDLIQWGPFPVTIGDTIGETVGVVRNKEFALGIQALNAKTLGGYPWNENDAMPQLDIFEGDDYSDLSEKGKRYVLYRVEAAKPTEFGSTLQAYTRNRFESRIIENWGKDNYEVQAYADGGVVGSKIALFGVPTNLALTTLGAIEIEEDLPHPMIDGQWGKQARSASAAYLIMGFDESNFERAIEYTKRAGLRYLYHDGPFETWGNFKLNAGFPNGKDGLKRIVERAEAEGIMVGLHTLSNFITTNDPYVSPIPDARLAKVGSSKLVGGINSEQIEMVVESPDFFKQFQNNNLKTVQIGDELIRYGSVSEEAPWRLIDCQRGAYGTKASEHTNETTVSLLADHGYKVFLSNPELGEEMAENIADLYNYAGLRQISFDGIEGNRSTGMGNYGEILFAQSWYNRLSDEIKSHYIADASRTSHYFWHIYTRMNWGEPWYAGFRESQTEYRLKNQAYFKRNYMPGMLGWFSMRPTTSIEDIEWMLARSAAFNAGYAYVANIKAFEENGFTDEILNAINQWEKARMGAYFSQVQKSKMEDINREFHLETVGENHWNLYEIQSFKFNHQKKVRQPGEPLFSTFDFENEDIENEMAFIITAVDSDLSNISLELDNYKRIEIPSILKKGYALKYTGGQTAILYDQNWQKKGEVIIEEILDVTTGRHSINFDCNFSNEGTEPMAKLEIRISGKAESIGQ